MHVTFVSLIQVRLHFKVVSPKRSPNIITKGSPPAAIRMVYSHIATSIAKCGYTALASKISYYKQNNHNQATVPFTAVNGVYSMCNNPLKLLNDATLLLLLAHGLNEVAVL